MSLNSQGMKVKAEFVAKDKDGNIIGQSVKEDDMTIKAGMQFFLNDLFATVQTTVKDTGNTSRDITSATIASILLVAGSATTAPNFVDYKLNTPITHATDGQATATVTWNGTATSFTVTGTFTNTDVGDVVYGEAGIQVTTATTNYNFLITHDRTNGATGYTISNGGTLDATYTITLS